MALMQQALQLIIELVRAEHADIAQPALIGLEIGIGQFLAHAVITDLVDLQRKEQQRRRYFGDPVLHGGEETTDFRIAHVTGIGQMGKAHDPGQHLVDALIFADRFGQFGTGQLVDPALVLLVECLRCCIHGLKIFLEFRAIGGGVEISQIPDGQVLIALGGGGNAVRGVGDRMAAGKGSAVRQKHRMISIGRC